MPNDVSNANSTGNDQIPDLEKQGTTPASQPEVFVNNADCKQLTVVVSEPFVLREPTAHDSKAVVSQKDTQLPFVDSPKKGYLSQTSSSHDQCRICQQEKEEILIDLGCRCRGGLSKAHLTCIETWFQTRGSNRCEICQDVAANVPPPQSQPNTNYWVWRINPTFRTQDRERGCFSPLWVAFAILIGGLLLDVLMSITLGVAALPVNIIIGVLVVLGLGTALRLALEFCHEWSLRRVAERVETNVSLGYHPAL